PRRAAGGPGGRAARPHRRRHRGPARPGQGRVPRPLREEGGGRSMSEPTDPQDPFEELALPVERQEPRPEFRRRLRHQLAAALGLDAEIGTVPLPERTTMSTSTTRTPAVTGIEVTPYLAVAGGAAAIDWYVEALGAVEQFRVVGDDGRLGHAEITIGSARIML